MGSEAPGLSGLFPSGLEPFPRWYKDERKEDGIFEVGEGISKSPIATFLSAQTSFLGQPGQVLVSTRYGTLALTTLPVTSNC